MADFNKLADALENIAHMEYPSAHHDGNNLREAARILRAAAAVDVAGLMAMAEAMANAAYASAVDYINGAGADSTKEVEAEAALESALRMALAAREWQPIETAPKDGTRILVCNKANYVYPARWQGVESGKPADWPQGWRDDVMFVAADGIVSWMPLQTPPNPSKPLQRTDMDKATVESVMAKAMMLVGALGDSCEAATSLPFLEAVTALRADVERLAAQAAPTDTEMVLVPPWKGYALLGTGNYILNSSAAPPDPKLGAEFFITFATDADKSGNRQVGETRANDPNAAPVQPEEMVLRIGFLTPQALCALEGQLRVLREENFPESVAAQPSQAPVVQAVRTEVRFRYESMKPVEGYDAIYAEYATTFGRYPDDFMAQVVRQTKEDLFMWWGAHREKIRAALVLLAEQEDAVNAGRTIPPDGKIGGV